VDVLERFVDAQTRAHGRSRDFLPQAQMTALAQLN